ncbi:MAG: glycosyltransferase family 9 protein [Acidobacteriota bacterium]
MRLVPSVPPASFHPSRILVVRLSALGDVVRTLPLLPPLKARFPSASLAWLCESPSQEILEPQPLLDQVLVFPRSGLRSALAGGRLGPFTRLLRQTCRHLSSPRFDLVLDAQGTLKSGLLCLLSRAPVRVGFSRGAAREFLPGAATIRVRVPGPPISRVDKALRLLVPLGARPELAAASLPISPATAAQARELWRAAGPRPWLLMSPGTSPRQAYKRWPAEQFGQLAAALRASGATVRVAWGPGESELARRVAVTAGAPDMVLPSTSLSLLAEMARAADLFIGNDSGPMHVAWLVGTRVVAIYGTTDPVINAPWGEGHTIVTLPAGVRRQWPRDPALMADIPVEEVLAAVRMALEDSRSRLMAAPHATERKDDGA